MKKFFLILVIFLPLMLSAQTSWVKWWPQSPYESVWPNNILKSYDEGYVFHWQYFFFDGFDMIYGDRLYKTDSLGNLIWEKEWNTDLGHTELNTLNQMPDSSYLWAGRYIVKVTPDGQIAWSIDLDTLIDYGAEIYTSTLTSDGNIVFLALEIIGSDGYWWLFKVDSNGNILWTKTYQVQSRPVQIKIFAGEKIIATGAFGVDGFNLLKFTNLGDLYWSKYVTHPNFHSSSGMLVDSQTNLLVYGTGASHLFYLDTLGNVLWDKHIDLPDTNLAIGGIVTAVEKDDSSYVITTWGIGLDEINAILKTDKSGEVEWWNELPGSPLDYYSSRYAQCNLIIEKDGYVMGLHKEDNDRTIGIAKTDSNGIITDITSINNKTIKNIILYQNYPNPFNASTTISFQLPKSEMIDLTIYNILGEKVETVSHQKFSPGIYHITWNANQFPSGIYFYCLKLAGNKIITNKMLLIK